jgi:hypothetical protein
MQILKFPLKYYVLYLLQVCQEFKVNVDQQVLKALKVPREYKVNLQRLE